MMWKLIFLGLLIWLAIHVLKHIANKANTPDIKQKATGSQTKPENMVQCNACAVHLPRSEAFLVNGNFYCCQAHIKK